MRGWIAAGLVVALGMLGAALPAASPSTTPKRPAHFADASDRALVIEGRKLYLGHCSGCHGRYLQGQALWELRDGESARRAPALDQTGHVAEYNDDELFRMVSEGRYGEQAVKGSAMPRFAARLSERQRLAVVAFIKARLPVGERLMQGAQNPGPLGMSVAVVRSQWRFAPKCGTAHWQAQGGGAALF